MSGRIDGGRAGTSGGPPGEPPPGAGTSSTQRGVRSVAYQDMSKLHQANYDDAAKGRLLQLVKGIIAQADPEGTGPIFDYADFILYHRQPAFQEQGEQAKEALRSAKKDGQDVDEFFADKRVKDWLETRPAWRVDASAEDRLTPQERTLFILGMLMAMDVDAGLHLAVHIYTAVAVHGISHEKIANTLRVAQVYCGLPAYTAAIRTFEKVVTLMAKSDPENPELFVHTLAEAFDRNF